MKRLERAIRLWAERTDAVVNDWNVKQWVADLENSYHDEERILLAMKYLVSIDKKPNLDTIYHIMKNNLDSKFMDEMERDRIAPDGLIYFRMMMDAMNSHNHWEEIRDVMEWGKAKAPDIDWSKAIAEVEMEIEKRGSRNLPLGGSQETHETI